jgi:ATP-binding cassette subfamily B protein
VTEESEPGTAASPDRRRTARRLLGILRPYRSGVVAMTALGFGSIILNLFGPGLLGHATDLIFAGLVSRGLPSGTTRQEVIEHLRATGQNTLANVFTTVDVVPGQGIDFRMLGLVLLLILGLYVVGSVCMLLQGRLVTSVVSFSLLHQCFITSNAEA